MFSLSLRETPELICYPTAGELAEEIGMGLSTLKYNLDSLIEVDMIRVSEVKGSQRGRRIKFYRLVKKMIVLIPGCGSDFKKVIPDNLRMELLHTAP